jgi:hypothetical protein
VCRRDDDAQCADGLFCFCDDRAADGSCNVDTTCRSFGEVGDDCAAFVDPACMPGLLCDDATDTCARLDLLYMLGEDEPCEAGAELCEPPLVCQSTGAGAEGVCRPTVGEGATCRRSDPDPCPPQQYCDADSPGVDGTCEDRPADAEPCLPANRTPRCIDGHRCIDDVCVRLKDNGEDCEGARECYSGVCEGLTCMGPAMCEAP